MLTKAVKAIKAFDDTVFAALLWATSTRQAFRLLTLIIIIASIIQPPHGLYQWLVLIVSVFYQGVALPGLGHHSKMSEIAAEREGAANRKLTKEMHDMVKAEFNMMRKELALAREERDELRQIIAKIG